MANASRYPLPNSSKGANVSGTQDRKRWTATLMRCSVLVLMAAAVLTGTVSRPAAGAALSSTGLSTGTPNAASASQYFAGYTVTPAAGLASASATVVIPTVTCGSSRSVVYFGLSDTDVSTGDSLTLVTIFVQCGGSPSPLYEILVQINGIPGCQSRERAGDKVVLSLSQTGSRETGTFDDLRNGTECSAYTYPPPDSTVDIGTSGGGGQFPKTTFSKVKVNGENLSLESRVRYDELSGTTKVAVTSKIQSPGDTFWVTFKNT